MLTWHKVNQNNLNFKVYGWNLKSILSTLQLHICEKL